MSSTEKALVEYVDYVATKNWWNGYLSGISTGMLLAMVLTLAKKK